MPTDMRQLIERTENHLQRMLFFRRQYDERRMGFYRQYLGSRDQKFFPDGRTPRSNTFVPYPQSNVETITSRTMDAIFGFNRWFDCKGRGRQDADPADAMGKVLDYVLRKANLVQTMETVIKNAAIYGFTGVKVDWDWEQDIVNYAEPVLAMDDSGQPLLDPNTGQPVVRGFKQAVKPVPRMCPRFTAIDIYDLLVDPDGSMTAFLTERTFGQIMQEAQAKPDLYNQEALQELARRVSGEKDPNSIIIRMAELWDDVEKTCTLLTFGKDTDGLAWKDRRASYRQANYSTYKRQIYGGPSLLLWHGPSQFKHLRNPILYTSYVKLPNELFGLGAIEPIAELTEGLNKFVNMITDNWNLGINRRYAYDIHADFDQEALRSFNVPGGTVGVSGDPNKVIAPLPFFTPSAQDYMPMQLYQNMIEVVSGISDFYSKGVGGPGANTTATGIERIVNESNYRFKAFIRNVIKDILEPMLEMCASMVQQFMPDEFEIAITDAPPTIAKYPMVRIEELSGNFSFELVAENYESNKMIRQRNLLAFANVVGGSAFWNEYAALQEMAKVFEVPNIDRLLKTPEQVAMEQQAALKQQIQMMILESMLSTESKARLSQAKPKPVGQGAGGGRPAKAQFEGKIPGAGLTSSIRDLAQSIGGGALGLEGMGEVGGG